MLCEVSGHLAHRMAELTQQPTSRKNYTSFLRHWLKSAKSQLLIHCVGEKSCFNMRNKNIDYVNICHVGIADLIWGRRPDFNSGV
jgi:hypothetical protein